MFPRNGRPSSEAEDPLPDQPGPLSYSHSSRVLVCTPERGSPVVCRWPGTRGECSRPGPRDEGSVGGLSGLEPDPEESPVPNVRLSRAGGKGPHRRGLGSGRTLPLVHSESKGSSFLSLLGRRRDTREWVPPVLRSPRAIRRGCRNRSCPLLCTTF